MRRLETSRLLLRELGEADFEAVHAYASDPEVVRYTSFGPNTEDQTRAFLVACQLERATMPRRAHTLAVIARRSGELIGSGAVAASDATGQQWALGYCFRRSSWRQGYGKETAAALTRWGFEELGAHRLWAWVFTENRPSARILEGLGFRCEGLSKEALFARGAWHDVLTYALLRREFSDRS